MHLHQGAVSFLPAWQETGGQLNSLEGDPSTILCILLNNLLTISPECPESVAAGGKFMTELTVSLCAVQHCSKAARAARRRSVSSLGQVDIE